MDHKILLSVGITACLGTPSPGQNGPVTSNLKRVLVYSYGYSSDHANTPAWDGYFIKLGADYGFSVDTTSNPSAFTTGNLTNYQAIVLFNALNFGTQMTQAQKDAVRAWYGDNHGMACFHQCVKNQWGGNYPDWYDSLMGVQYDTWAGFATGPVYVDSSVVGTDLARSSDGTPYPANYSITWNDEWYTYLADPGKVPGTKMMWTTHRSAFNFSGSAGFNLAGEVQPMAWAREALGGRFVLNSMFHTDTTRTSTDLNLRKFVDGAFLGILRYAAGYSGCMDSSYLEYNPKATDSGAGACVNLKTTSIRVEGDVGNSLGEAGTFHVTFTQPGEHTVEVLDIRGRRVFFARGEGARKYRFDDLPSGLYFLQARAGNDSFNRRFLLF